MTGAVGFVQSIRFRLSILYSSVVFGLGAAILGLTYYFLQRSLRRLPLMVDSREISVGGRRFIIQDIDIDTAQLMEQAITQRALSLLSDYSVVALIVLFLLSLVVGWVIAGRALSPVARITSVANEIQASDLSRRIGYEGPEDELSRLANTFDDMLERLDIAFDAQRRFLADTSHDLRTPLAVIRSNIEVLTDDPAADLDDWRAAGEIVSRNAGRMADMIDDLLAAARLEMRHAATVQVDLSELVTEALSDLGPRAAAASVSVAGRAEPALTEGVPQALRRALANLADNALKVAPPGSVVTLASGASDGWAWMAVADEGPGIDPSLVESGGRRGLGLAIVRQIAEGHRGHISAERGQVKGSLVVVWIPTGAAPGPAPSGLPPIAGLLARP